DQRGVAGGRVPGPDFDDAVGANAGSGDGRGVGEAVQSGAHAAHARRGSPSTDPEADLSSQFLPGEVGDGTRDVATDCRALRGEGARDDGRVADVTWRRPEDREPR